MIKRPIDQRFSDAVLNGRKITTIRSNPWPIGVPIMLYSWSGKPYQSKHKNVCAVIAERTMPIQLSRSLNGNVFETPAAPILCEGKPLHECEGFDSVDDFYDWFRPLIKPGQTITKTLIRFRIQTN